MLNTKLNSNEIDIISRYYQLSLFPKCFGGSLKSKSNGIIFGKKTRGYKMISNYINNFLNSSLVRIHDDVEGYIMENMYPLIKHKLLSERFKESENVIYYFKKGNQKLYV